MKYSIRYLFALAFSLLASTALRATEPMEIAQRWEAGRKYFQTMQTEEQSTIEISGQKIDQASSLIIELSITVAPRVDGQPKRMTIRYERTAMQVGMNGQKMSYDSAHPGENTDPLDLAKTVGATVGKELKLALNENDEVTDVENYDAFVRNLAPSAVAGFDPSKMFNRESLTHMLQEGGLRAMPGKPVVAGDTWPFKTRIDLPQLGKVSMTGTYTLKSIGDHDGAKCAEITTDGTLFMELGGAAGGDDNPAAATPSEVKVSDGTLKGTIWFDPRLGMARDTQMIQEMTVSMKDPLDSAATIAVPMKQTISVKLTKVEDVR